ncbi:MAG TPA: hypothetical protein VJ875_05505 [Pyrinomonadaceae bacterium]|nr:hypothetical protein [Pyrinomonadaceae bacterium]
MHIPRKLTVVSLTLLFVSALVTYENTASAGLTGALYTTTKDGTAVNKNIYGSLQDVYISGGPQNLNASGLPDGTYYFLVTDPSGKTLLSTDNAVCRQLIVTNGRVAGAAAAAGVCKHANGTFNPANGTLPVQLAPFSASPNKGSEFKVWIVPVGSATVSGSDPKVITFNPSDAASDSFKARSEEVVQGSCQPSSSLSVLVSGTNVVAYVPKGNWGVTFSTGVAAVNVEGASITNTLIPTSSVVNSCASNPLTGQTVCTANNSNVYVIKGTALDPAVAPNPLNTAGSGTILFSGGSCTNCGVAMDATHNKAVIALSLAGAGGFQFLNLGSSPSLEPAFLSKSPNSIGLANISEDPLIDPIRNLLLSASENSSYEIIDVTNSTTPLFFENIISPFEFLDSSGEDCATGIVLAPAEFSGPSHVYIADISNPAFAPFTPGSPGSWTAPAQVQSLSESFLSAGASGIAVAQGTHLGVVTGEFGGNTLTAIALPAVSGGGVTPAISDWVTCGIGNGFNNGFDPHTVTAYRSPANGHAIALLANDSANMLAVVDLNNMLDPTIVSRSLAGHGCTIGQLPPSVVSFISLP